MKVKYLQQEIPEKEEEVERFKVYFGTKWYNLTEEQREYEAMRLYAAYQRFMGDPE
jgi:hypothetical protein